MRCEWKLAVYPLKQGLDSNSPLVILSPMSQALIRASQLLDKARQNLADNPKSNAALVALVDAEEAYRKARKAA